MKETIRNIANKLSSLYDARECNSIARYIVEEISGMSYTNILVKDTKFSARKKKNVKTMVSSHKKVFFYRHIHITAAMSSTE